MMRTLRVIALALLAGGCVHQRVVAEAAPTLRCPELEISLRREKAPRTWTAMGCGRAAICVLPEVEDADVQCAGGGPLARAGGY